MLQKAKRPCVLIVKMAYKGEKLDFAVPFRSNIHPSEKKEHYFGLPPRNSTKPGYRHGLHYIKMFPVSKTARQKYRVSGNKFAELIRDTIDKNEDRIVRECKEYLKNYENGIHPKYSTDIDLLLSKMKASLATA